MRLLDSIRIALRYIRHRLLESFVVVLGIALGVGVISAVLGIYATSFGSLNDSLQNPTWREIAVRPNTASFRRFTSIQRIDPQTGGSGPVVSFMMDDLAAAKAACPSVDYAYVAFWEQMQVGEAAMPGRLARRVQRSSDGTVTSTEQEAITGQPRAGGAATDEAANEGATAQTFEPNPAVAQFRVRAVTPEFFGAYAIAVAHGSLISHADVEAELPVMVLGARLAGQLYPEVDPAELVGTRLLAGGISFTIVGIAERREEEAAAGMLDAVAMIPATVSRGYQFGGTLHTLTFSVDDPQALDRAVAELENHFSVEFDDEVEVVNQRAQFEEQRRRVVPVLAVVGLLASVGFVVASINIMNLMLARVVRRRKTIGISAALGGSRATIFKQYLSEAMVLGLLGGIVGVGLAALLTRILSLMLSPRGPAAAAGPDLSLSLTTVAVALGITLVVNLVFAVYPAYKASAVDPAEALRA